MGFVLLLGRPWFEGHLVWVQAPESLRKPTLNLTHNLTSPGPLSPRGRGPSSCCILEPSRLDAPQCLSCKQWPLWCSGLNTGLPVVRSHLSFPSPPCFLPVTHESWAILEARSPVSVQHSGNFGSHRCSSTRAASLHVTHRYYALNSHDIF